MKYIVAIFVSLLMAPLVHADQASSVIRARQNYNSYWKDCVQDNECTYVQEGNSWTCVNKKYEEQVRPYMKSVDSMSSEVDCKFSSLGTLFPRCVDHSCECEEPYASKSSTSEKNVCQWNADCKLESGGGGWITTSKSDNTVNYYFYSGSSSCQPLTKYPPPIVYCVEGRCRLESEVSSQQKKAAR